MFALIYTFQRCKFTNKFKNMLRWGGKKMLILLYFMKFSSKRTFPQAF